MSPREEPEDNQQRSHSPPRESKADDLHPSILTNRDMMTTPINVLSHPFVIANSRLQSLRSPISMENLYTMVTQLDSRVNKQEKEILVVKSELRAKEAENADLRQQLQIARGDGHSATQMDLDSGFLDTLRTEFPLLSEGLGKVEGDIIKVGDDIHDLNTKIESLQKQLKYTERKCHLEGDQRDQYSRRDTIRVSGVPYKRGEDTNDIICRIAFSINVAVTPWDISVSHRSGRPNAKGIKAIICRFTRRDIKHKIMENRKLTREIRTDDENQPVQIFIDESLTPMRAAICRKLRGENIAHYTRDGKVFINPNFSENERDWKVYDTPSDWENLPWPVSEKVKLGLYPRE